MPDKTPKPEPEVVPIHFTQYVVRTVTTWPERTSFAPATLAQPHLMGATVDGDNVMIATFNGYAVYRLNRELPGPSGSIVADLVSSKKTSRVP